MDRGSAAFGTMLVADGLAFEGLANTAAIFTALRTLPGFITRGVSILALFIPAYLETRFALLSLLTRV